MLESIDGPGKGKKELDMTYGVSLRFALRDLANIVRAKPGSFGLVCVVWLAVNTLFDLLMGRDDSSTNLNVLRMLPLFLVWLWIVPGINYLALRAASGEAWSVYDSFRGAKWMGRFMGISIVIGVLCFITIGIPFITIFSPFTQTVFTTLSDVNTEEEIKEFEEEFSPTIFRWSLAFGCGISAIATFFGFSWYLAIDKAMGVFKAIEYSLRLIRGAILQVVPVMAILYISSAVLPIVSGVDWLGGIVSDLIWIFATFLVAIMYRDRVRQWEIEHGHPLHVHSMVSLPPEAAREEDVADAS